jgi:hypothetical protein
MVVRLHRWFVATIIYVLLVLALLAARPSLMFDAHGDPKPPGLGLSDGYSFASPAVAFPVLAVLSYFAAAWFYVVLV